MPTHPVHPSPTLRSRAEHSGDAGRRWLAALPDLVAEFEARWSITVGQPLPDANEAYVAHAVREDGTPVVLKLNLPLDHRRSQIEVLERARGHGYAQVHAADHERQAILLESLGPTLASLKPRPIGCARSSVPFSPRPGRSRSTRRPCGSVNARRSTWPR
jgi:streptomycin 6-kinase